MALPKINAFKSTKDGHSAWMKLNKHYYAKSNKQAFANMCLQKLMDLKLDSNSIGGPEQYISNYEDLLLKLEEAGDPLTEGQKKTFFLAGIKDRNYAAYKTLCGAQPEYDFDKCVVELCREADEISNIHPKREIRQANNYISKESKKDKPKDKPQTPNKLHLPQDV